METRRDCVPSDDDRPVGRSAGPCYRKRSAQDVPEAPIPWLGDDVAAGRVAADCGLWALSPLPATHAVREPDSRWRLPFARDEHRLAYERVMPAAWRLVKRTCPGVGARGALYLDRDVRRVLWPVAAHAAYAVVSDEDQRLLLGATGGLPEDYHLQSLWPLTRCPLCVLYEYGTRRRPRPHTPHWLRHAFTHRLQEGLSWAFDRQDPYDLRLGMPRRTERLSLRYGGPLPAAPGELHVSAGQPSHRERC